MSHAVDEPAENNHSPHGGELRGPAPWIPSEKNSGGGPVAPNSLAGTNIGKRAGLAFSSSRQATTHRKGDLGGVWAK